MLSTTDLPKSIPVLFFLLVFALPALSPAQDGAAAGKAYTVVLNSGREIACSHYYERDGQIFVVIPHGEMAYSKEDVAEIREKTIAPSQSGSAPRSASTNPGNPSSADSCKFPATMLFQAELRRLPRNAAAADSRIDELIAQERARIAELEGQLPALREQESDAHDDTFSERQKKYGLAGEDVIAVSRQASGIATAGGPVLGTITFEDPARYKRKYTENEIARSQCNIFWAEKKRSQLKK